MLKSETQPDQCPRCGGMIQSPGAISRVNNRTEICARCSEEEAGRPPRVATGDKHVWWIVRRVRRPVLRVIAGGKAT